jgi:hypothetical protein
MRDILKRPKMTPQSPPNRLATSPCFLDSTTAQSDESSLPPKERLHLKVSIELNLQHLVLNRLRVLFPAACIRKRHGSRFSVSGDPDVYALVAGCHIEMELKRPGEEPTRLQAHRLQEWAAAGAHCAVVHTIDELEKFITHLQQGGYLPPTECSEGAVNARLRRLPERGRGARKNLQL